MEHLGLGSRSTTQSSGGCTAQKAGEGWGEEHNNTSQHNPEPILVAPWPSGAIATTWDPSLLLPVQARHASCQNRSGNGPAGQRVGRVG